MNISEIENLKTKVEDNTNLLIKQFKKMDSNEYEDFLLNYLDLLFSDNFNNRKKAINKYRDLLDIKLWDGYGFTSHNPKYSKYYKDEFIEEFNSFDEFYSFLEGLVKDVEEYYKLISNS